MSVTASTIQLTVIGQQTALTATARDAAGELVPASFIWVSDDPAVISVDVAGVATALSPGTASVAATAEGVAGSVGLTVAVGADPGTSGLSVSTGSLYPGDWGTVRLITRDAGGTPLSQGGLSVSFMQMGGASQVEVLPAEDMGDGNYQAVFVARESGASLVIEAHMEGVAVDSTETIDIDVPTDVSSPTPLVTMQGMTYLGFPGGLYPGGNIAPPWHDSAGRAIAASMGPLDAAGQPGPTGEIVMLSIGMSNATQEFCSHSSGLPCDPWTFSGQALGDPTISASVAIVNGARGGATASFWESPSAADYDRINVDRLGPAGLTEAQVQVVWIKLANGFPTISLPSSSADAYDLLRSSGNIMRALKQRYPNLALVFLGARTYAGFATTQLNPEPYAFETGLAMRWLTEAQILQRASGGTRTDPQAGDLDYATGVAPWIGWGPYLWAAGSTPNPDGLFWVPGDFETDGTHPSQSGEQKVADRLLAFMKTSPYTIPWFLQ